MSLPHLLLVDDSQAILSYETASLADHYAISTAMSGREALEQLEKIHPAAVLLDLSMPEMDGNEVLARMKANPALSDIPVIIVSTESHRAALCIEAGAAAYLPKPIRADALRALVTRVLDEARRRVEEGSVGVLFVTAARTTVGLPLEAVRAVVLQPATIPTSLGGSAAFEILDFHGEAVCVLDLARHFKKPHTRPLVDRKIVVLRRGPSKPAPQQGAHPLGLGVDDVRAPELFLRSQVTALDSRALLPDGTSVPALGVVDLEGVEVPIVDPLSYFAASMLAAIPEAIERARAASTFAMRLAP